jgi:hypothetical protein
MNRAQLKKLCQSELDRIIDRMHDLCAEGRSEDASSLYEEIRDWIDNHDELEVLSLDYINGQF